VEDELRRWIVLIRGPVRFKKKNRNKNNKKYNNDTAACCAKKNTIQKKNTTPQHAAHAPEFFLECVLFRMCSL